MPKFKPGTIKTYREYAVKGVQPEYDRLKAEVSKLEELFPELRGKTSVSMKKAWRQRKAAAATAEGAPKRGRGRPRKDVTVAAKPERKAVKKASKKKKAAATAETGTGDNQ